MSNDDSSKKPTLAYNESTTLATCSSVSIAAPYVFYVGKCNQQPGINDDGTFSHLTPAHRTPANNPGPGPARRGTPCRGSFVRVCNTNQSMSDTYRMTKENSEASKKEKENATPTSPRQPASPAQPPPQHAQSRRRSRARQCAGGSAGAVCRTARQDVIVLLGLRRVLFVKSISVLTRGL